MSRPMLQDLWGRLHDRVFPSYARGSVEASVLQSAFVAGASAMIEQFTPFSEQHVSREVIEAVVDKYTAEIVEYRKVLLHGKGVA